MRAKRANSTSQAEKRKNPAASSPTIGEPSLTASRKSAGAVATLAVAERLRINVTACSGSTSATTAAEK